MGDRVRWSNHDFCLQKKWSCPHRSTRVARFGCSCLRSFGSLCEALVCHRKVGACNHARMAGRHSRAHCEKTYSRKAPISRDLRERKTLLPALAIRRATHGQPSGHGPDEPASAQCLVRRHWLTSFARLASSLRQVTDLRHEALKTLGRSMKVLFSRIFMGRYGAIQRRSHGDFQGDCCGRPRNG